MPPTAETHSYMPSPAARLMGWARQGVETFVTAQNILLDLTAQQSALAIGVIRERMDVRSLRPRISVSKVADDTVASATSAGKILLNLAAGENAVVTEAVKEGLRLSPRSAAVADLVRARVETFIEMNKRLLDSAAEQTHAVVEAYEDGRGLQIRKGLAEMARQGLIGLIETEQKFLDIATEQVTVVLEPPKEARKPVRDRAKALGHLAHQSVDNFADAQKKLIDLAITQLSSNGNSHEEEDVDEESKTPLAEVTRKGFQNIVTAQKALMDVAIKPIRPAARKHEPPKPAVRAKRKK